MMKVFASVVIGCFVVATCRGGENSQGSSVLIDAPPAGEGDRRQPPHDVDGSPSRSKRSTPSCGVATQLTADQQTEAVSVHNSFRSREPAGDELQLSWNDTLAAQAQAWAENCLWKHGMLTDCNGNTIGQNLYMIGNGSTYANVSLTDAITSWSNERQNWNFSSASCQPNQVCGHWTQVAWSRSSQVGCGYAQCPAVTITSTGAIFYNALIIACDYSPPGNYVNQPVYTPGANCSACSTITRKWTTNRGYLAACVNNLCVPCTPVSASDETCTCGTPDVCYNGGSWNTMTCSCTCAAGYYGTNCQTKCADGSSSCSYWSGLGYCSTTSIYYGFMKQNCASTCSLCF